MSTPAGENNDESGCHDEGATFPWHFDRDITISSIRIGLFEIEGSPATSRGAAALTSTM